MSARAAARSATAAFATGTLALASACALAAGSASAAEAEPRVRAELRLSAQAATLHQQVVCSLRILHPLWARPRWEAPAFEGFWSTRLSSIGEAVQSEEHGRRLRATIFRRALFPTRTGTLSIPTSSLVYTDEDGIEHSVEVGGATLSVRPLPTRGQPERFAGVVGNLEVSAYLATNEVALGRSVKLTIDYYGDANLWDAPVPSVEGVFGPAIEVFSERPTFSTGERQGMATARRSFHYHLVAQELGRFILPPFELAYFDPGSRAYAHARSERISLEVVRPRALRESKPWEPRAAVAPPSRLAWLVSGALLLGVAALVGWGMLLWWRSALRPVFGPPPPSPRALFEAACDAVGTRGFPELLSRALKAGLHARYHFDPLPYTSEELERRIDDSDAIALLRRLDRARFAPGRPDTEALLEAVRRYLDL